MDPYSSYSPHVFLCAALVWWPRLKYQRTVLEMNKLQRLPLLAICGAMRTTPTASIQFLPNNLLTACRLNVISEWQKDIESINQESIVSVESGSFPLG